MVPLPVFFDLTDTPDNGTPFASDTFPVTVCCANVKTVMNKKEMKRKRGFLILFDLVVKIWIKYKVKSDVSNGLDFNNDILVRKWWKRSSATDYTD
jgi:predicted nucleic acid-binding Zn ribbon protein